MKKILPLAVLITNMSCGDNNYYLNESNEGQAGAKINNCQDAANLIYQCDPQSFADYEQQWDISVAWQREHLERECEKVGFFQNAPLWIDCMERSSCEEIKAGNCDQYMVDY